MANEVLLLAAIAFVGATIFGITGFGSALVTIPLATHFVPLRFALALFALVDLCSALSVGLENPKRAVASEWKRLVPMILAGTVFGVTLLINLPRGAATFLLGLFIFLYALYSLLRRTSPRVVHSGWAWVAGFCGGITSSLFGAGGPPYAIYLSQRGLTKEQFRATMGFAAITSISLRTTAFFITGSLLDWRVWQCAAAAVPAALLAIYIARRLYHRISREAVMRAIAVILLASGGSLIFRALH